MLRCTATFAPSLCFTPWKRAQPYPTSTQLFNTRLVFCRVSFNSKMLASRTSVSNRTLYARKQSSQSPRLVSRNVTSAAASPVITPADAPITLTDAALTQLKKLKSENKNSDVLLLRVGVKQGGCSGLSYVMDFEDKAKITPDDTVVAYDSGSFELAIDPKSLLYLFGMSLDHSTELIGGGFKFMNPNATDSCGCGKSFGV